MACGSCLLGSGFQYSCQNKQPGGNNISILIGNQCEWTITDANADGIYDTVTDITVGGTATFYEIKANKDTVTTLENIILPNKFVTQNVTFNIQNIAEDPSLQVGATLQIEFLNELLNGEEYFVIIKDRAGVFRVYGLVNGLAMSNGEKGSGAALTDVASTAITLEGAEPSYAPVIDATTVAGIPTV